MLKLRLSLMPCLPLAVACLLASSPSYGSDGSPYFMGLGDLSGGDIHGRPSGVSADGSVVVGSSDSEAFRWTRAGGMVGLGFLEFGDAYSSATGISADGSIIAGYADPGPVVWYTPFVWTISTEMEALPLQGRAFGISADGSTLFGEDFGDDAFRYTSEGGTSATSLAAASPPQQPGAPLMDRPSSATPIQVASSRPFVGRAAAEC